MFGFERAAFIDRLTDCSVGRFTLGVTAGPETSREASLQSHSTKFSPPKRLSLGGQLPETAKK